MGSPSIDSPARSPQNQAMHIMKPTLTLMIGLGVLNLIATAHGQLQLVPFDHPPQIQGNLTNKDVDGQIEAADFLQSAWMDNKMEILKGDLAATRASGQTVKD